MKQTNHTAKPTDNTKRKWNWAPPLPIMCSTSPLYDFPLRPLAVLKHYWRLGFMRSLRMFHLLTAMLVWYCLLPPFEDAASILQFDWIALSYLRNFLLMLVIVGGVHLFLNRYDMQKGQYKFDPRPMSKNNSLFKFNNQVWDNMFWTLVSGVAIWTLYEVFFIWYYANGSAFQMDLTAISFGGILWFILLFPLLLAWQSLHFFFIHRFLHWRPMYRLFHEMHHRNTNIGVWSGFSMHPVEHLLYLSYLLVLLVIPAHSIHVMFMLHYTTIGTALGHSGFEYLLLGKIKISMSPFDHQLHHRYFECNYGNATEMPCDRWAGTFHDGTPEGANKMRARIKGNQNIAADA